MALFISIITDVTQVAANPPRIPLLNLVIVAVLRDAMAFMMYFLSVKLIGNQVPSFDLVVPTHC